MMRTGSFGSSAARPPDREQQEKAQAGNFMTDSCAVDRTSVQHKAGSPFLAAAISQIHSIEQQRGSRPETQDDLL